ncbi:pyrroline-5-carboxylate reductase [Dellaglioa carnosa]|uniref:pyrroline-5-carboxylate reductase n=1 Tax=Dellaglioa carnosa TaxID=2995136 RepID=UPI0022A81875|nr:pyrroline-5-carboxylate reductase [Dellaglioa carnosa]MCZ2493361.1 pyrroline-5-carboxylate reductase [Dellaglioa carnosa]
MKIGFIGAGNMARAIIEGLIKADFVTAKEILVHSARKTSYEPYAKENGLTALDSNDQVVSEADIVFLAVKPIVLAKVLAEIKSSVRQHAPVLVSIVSGVSISEIETELDNQSVSILRTMPNVNATVSESMTALVGNDALTEEQMKQGTDLFDTIGETMQVAEHDFSTFVALAGSSPAFIYLFIDTLARAGVKYGLAKDEATKISAQAVLGSAKKVLSTNDVPWKLIDEVSSPGGTTVAGLLAMEEAGFMNSIIKAVDATIAKDQN